MSEQRENVQDLSKMGKPAAISRTERARAGSDVAGKILNSKRPVLVSVNGILNERFKTTRIIAPVQNSSHKICLLDARE